MLIETAVPGSACTSLGCPASSLHPHTHNQIHLSILAVLAAATTPYLHIYTTHYTTINATLYSCNHHVTFHPAPQNPFVEIWLDGACHRTSTIMGKTSTPFDDAAFTFEVKDITATLDVRVFSARPLRSPKLIGRVLIPLTGLHGTSLTTTGRVPTLASLYDDVKILFARGQRWGRRGW